MSGGQGDDDSDKSFEPTQKKLDDARKKGDVPRSQDLNATAAYAGLFIAIYALTTGAGGTFATALTQFVERADEHAQLVFDGSPNPLFADAMGQLFPALVILFGIPAVFVITSVVAQRSFTFAPSKLEPKLSRLSILSNAKNKFGISGLFEFGKSFTKLVIFSICLALLIYSALPDIVGSARAAPRIGLSYLSELLVRFLSIVILVSAAVGAVDFLFQHADHHRKLRMSRKEVMDETKESEGDPHLKQARRQRGVDRAMNQSLQDVATADVVITNPTHFAVALKWSRKPGEAPVCVAKGQDNLAAQIREIAMENAVPLHPDPPTARAIYATTDIGEEVPPDLYRAVAAAIRFSEAMRERRRKGFV